MKILLLINSLKTGGAENLIVEIAEKLHTQNQIIEVFLLDGEKTILKERLLDKKVKIITWKSFNIYNPMNIIGLRRVMNNYDLIHVHLFPSLYWAALADIFILRKRYKLLFTEHNTTNRRRDFPFLKVIDKIIYSRYDNIIAISDSVEKNLSQYLSVSKKIEKIYNGVDLSKIINATAISRDELNLDYQDKLILQVSSFTKQKNQKTLIKSLQFLPARFKVLLVGDGPLKDTYRKLVSQLDLEDRVLFLGIRKDVPELMKTVDYIVLSSHYEGLSLASIEGMISGKPFLASAVPGLQEIVKENGILFPNNDHEKLASAIKSLEKDEALRREIIVKSMKKSTEFDINRMIQEHLELYEKMTEQ